MLKGKAVYLPPPSDCQHRFQSEPPKCGDLKVLFPNVSLKPGKRNALSVIADILCISVLSDQVGWV